MRVFVASWFFPPSTSSEGIVTYKLLRNSHCQYDVVSASTNKWGYKSHLEPDADNINIIPVETDELSVWRDACLRIFEQRYTESPYDAVMTRSMPNESLEIGLAIKEKHPSLLWICSLADPVANNPYWRNAIRTSVAFTEKEKKEVLEELALPSDKWSVDWLHHPNNVIRDQFYWKDVQDQALKKANLLISPVLEQLEYIDSDSIARNKCLVIPHTYDEGLYSQTSCDTEWESDKIHLTFTGYSDSMRSLHPILNAIYWIKKRYPDILQKIRIHFFGNYPREIIDRALAWQIEDVFDFSGNVSYLETLTIMQKSDWLLHIDAWFEELGGTGGSIFFAGKLADYMGAGKPILALTGVHSPANTIVDQYGGISILPWETVKLANALISIAQGESDISINESFRSLFRADIAAERFDTMLENLAKRTPPSISEMVFGRVGATKKLLTVCVPSYNSQKTLRRTLDSLLAVESHDALEIIVVDDGSSDKTAAIGREYVERYPESVLLVSKPNGGHGSGINQGLKHASGEYFRIVDSDDWVDPVALDGELQYIRDKKTSPDIIYTPYHVIDQTSGESSPWPLSSDIEFDRVYSFDELVQKIGVSGFYFTMHGSSLRTQLLRDMGFHSREKSFYTDSEFILKPIPNVNTVIFLSKFVYKYLCGQTGQSVAPASFVRNYTQHEAIVQDLIQYEQRTSMNDSQREYMRYYLQEHLVTNYKILLEYNPVPADALNRTKLFDKWLKENAPSYFAWTNTHIPLAKLARRINYQEKAFCAKRKAIFNKKKPIERIMHVVKRALQSSIFNNRYTMRIKQKLKDNNGIIYRIYKKII